VLDRHWKLWFHHFVHLNGWEVAGIDQRTIEEAYSLPEYAHRDPSDRIIIATARVLQSPVITPDERIRHYPHVDSVW
jgi:PIN domain nuclease of toxin-antitoxin system